MQTNKTLMLDNHMIGGCNMYEKQDEEITTTMMCKLRIRHFTKLEAMHWKVDTI